jgi:hypothetical protein
MLRMYLPLAADGLALIIASTRVVKFSNNFSLSKIVFPKGA